MAKATAAPGNAVGDAAAAAGTSKPAGKVHKSNAKSKAKVKSKAKSKTESGQATRATATAAAPKAVEKAGAVAEAAPLKKKPAAKAKAKKSKSGRAPRPSALVSRVFKTIERELSKLDKQEGNKSQDRERASRALSQMVNSLEKTISMKNAIPNSTARGGSVKDKATNKENLAYAESLRRQIVERLERFNGERSPAGSTERNVGRGS